MTAEYEEFAREMVIEGNIIHAVWANWVGNTEGYLFYCRSLDLGKTWEKPRQIYQFKDGGYPKSDYTQRLAVSGNHVYIGISDYDYYNNGTGYLYLVKSSDSGENFSAPVELDKSGGGFSPLVRSFIKASGSNVAVVYRIENYNGLTIGIYAKFSSDYGETFNKSTITTEDSNINDFWYDGERMILLHSYAYYYYGLNVGRIWVSVSGDNGATFTTSKVSVTYNDDYGEKEKCLSVQDYNYSPKIARDGSSIHIVFVGANEQGTWTVLYARSTDNGATFEKAVDINKGKIGNIQNGQETVAARGGNLYVTYLSTGGKPYLVRSDNYGALLSEPADLMTSGTSNIQTTWYPVLVIDPTDSSGKTLYFGGSPQLMTRKSSDGGLTFSGTQFLGPLLSSPNFRGSVLKVDGSGYIHWLSIARWRGGDYDTFYGHKMPQPEPGTINKSLHLETQWNAEFETVIVPSSPVLQFDTAMTGEAWIKIRQGGTQFSVFAKTNIQETYDYQPSGFNLGFRGNGAKSCVNAGLKTSQGDFINWGSCSIEDTLWHHVAFTYDANAGLNNFKTYVDGILNVEQTVTGPIIPGDGLLSIGSRLYVNYTSNYLLDDIRLWNRALSQEELIQNQTRAFTGQENGLALFLNFDDTYKDLSGNGNDGIPLYLGNLVASDFNPPRTAFDLYKVGNEVAFINKTNNATAYIWDFGDKTTSPLSSPKHTYTSPGEYLVSLLTKNSNSATAAVKTATVEGLRRVEPESAGNKGYATIRVYGGGVGKATEILLRKSGEADIKAIEVYSPGEGIISGSLFLGGKTTGLWDVVVKVNSTEYTLSQAFTIEEGRVGEAWMNFTGRGLVLVNTWYTYTIEYGNNGNVDLYGVPIWLALSNIPGLEVEFIDFEIVLPEMAYNSGFADLLLQQKPYFETTRVQGEDFSARVYSIVVPVIPANSKKSIHIRIKSPSNYRIKGWMTEPIFDTVLEQVKSAAWPTTDPHIEVKKAFVMCLAGSFAEQALDIALFPFERLQCFTQTAKAVYKHVQSENDATQKEKMWNQIYNHSTALFNCSMSIVGGNLALMYSFFVNGLDFVRSAAECSQMLRGTDWEWLVYTVLSFDPNQIVGPAGFGGKNYIRANRIIPYTIYFENKSTATAPAHTVTITDTLNLETFNLSDFGFSSFGWGDTIIAPPGNQLKEFSKDVDLRPGVNLITRVAAKLDTLTGIVKWEFVSLNPETMAPEEDPLTGFLPPNKTSPEGEGFVSFHVGLKEGLMTNSEVRNLAAIVFDSNPPILTNEYLNTLDMDAPQSEVFSLEQTTDSRFPVTWSGTDNGSGIKHFTIYVLKNDTLLYSWLTNTQATTAEFEGEVGSDYQFYSLATDNVSLLETEPGQYDARTTVTVDLKEFERVKESLKVWPNPVKNELRIRLDQAPCGLYVVELTGMNGNRIHSRLYESEDLRNGISVRAKDYPPGQYVLSIVFGNKSETRKILIQ